MSRSQRTQPGAIGIADIGGEWIMPAGGGCAILLQLAHPSVGRGVSEHSDFATRPYDRLIETLVYVTAVACGDETDIRAVRRSVSRAHAPVRGRTLPASDPESGGVELPPYSAFDPGLQRWVTATLYWTAMRLYERVFGPLDEASADRCYREFAAIGTSLQMPMDAWPADRAAFAEYWAATLPTLRVLPGARRTAHELLHAHAAPWWTRTLLPWVRLLTVGLLPDELRAPFGLRLTDRNRRRYERIMNLISAVYPRLPLAVRHLLRDALLRRLRARGRGRRDVRTAGAR